MSRTSWLQYVYLAHLSRPRGNRSLFRAARRHRPVRILEVGIGDLTRTVQLLNVAQRFAPDTTIKYAVLDAFDARPDGLEPLSVMTAHRQLQATAATVRLLPGDPAHTLTEVANSHQRTDLLLLAPWLSADDLQLAWAFVPRMLTPTSVVLWERLVGDDRQFRQISHDQIASLVQASAGRRAA